MNAIYEDNNGGDVLEIIDNEDGTYTFQVGNCCVYVLRKTGTITDITRWLTELTLELPKGVVPVEPWGGFK